MSVISSTQDTNTSIVLWQRSDTQGDTNNAGYRRPKSEIKNVDIDLPHKASRRHPVSTVQLINTVNRVKGGHMTLSMVHDAHPSRSGRSEHRMEPGVLRRTSVPPKSAVPLAMLACDVVMEVRLRASVVYQ